MLIIPTSTYLSIRVYDQYISYLEHLYHILQYIISSICGTYTSFYTNWEYAIEIDRKNTVHIPLLAFISKSSIYISNPLF
jgi:hypothetical protein